MYKFLQFTADSLDVCNLMYVGWLRYIQSLHEPKTRRNPDNLVGQLIPAMARWRARFLSKKTLANLRADPFYYFLLARSIYYDQVMLKGISEDLLQIIIIGCGTDTRAHRFSQILCSKGATVLECDQPEVIGIKRESAGRRWLSAHVSYLALDLNASRWPEFADWLRGRAGKKTLVLMEGVSPYIKEQTFCDFLRLLRENIQPGSLLAYDFKVQGSNNQLGRSGDTLEPFRLPRSYQPVACFHERLGFSIESMEFSPELCARLLPDVSKSADSFFSEDGLVQLRWN